MTLPLEHPFSYYAATVTEAVAAPPLDGSTRADVCILGGGYTGLSAALHLAMAGRRVVLLEQARLGWGASGRNGGQLHVGFRRDQHWLEQHLGREDAQAIWALCTDALDHFHHLLNHHAIACDFRPGLLHLDHRARLVPASHAYAAHMEQHYGYTGFEPLDRAAAQARVASPLYHGGLLSRDGGHLHALKFVHGLARAAQRAGAVLHEQTQVQAVQRRNGHWCARTARGDVEAAQLVLAGNALVQGLDAQTDAHVMPINNFIATTVPLDDPAALIRDGHAVADSRFVVRYFRITADRRLLFGGGETYGYRFPADIAAMVQRHMLQVFPQLAGVPIDHAWGGTLAVTTTRLPFVRQLQPGLYTAAGYSGQGVLLAPYFGKLLADALAGDSARFDLLSRLPVPAFPGGRLLRWPILVGAMLALRLRDML